MEMNSKIVTFRKTEVHYSDQGNGHCIFLLHGYLETGEIWRSFVPLLTGLGYRVISMDIPGHGRSGTWGKVHAMEDLAAVVKSVLDAEGINKVLLVGHSMGGYITLAFAELFPERIMGYVLFHSTCFADSEEKKQNREREISLVLCGKKKQIVNVNIPKAFSDGNLDKLKNEVTTARRIALQNPDQGIIALLNGMKGRRDRSGVLRNPSLPMMLIGGAGDNYIPVVLFERLMELAPHASSVLLGESGHMGFIEEPILSARLLADFIERCSSAHGVPRSSLSGQVS
jgi:pimeloyl-ACP methyl ester carboxylesterase